MLLSAFLLSSLCILQITEEARQITDLVYNSKEVAILCSESSYLDGVSAGLALYHLLESMGKNASVFYTGALPDNITDLPGVHRVKKQVDKKDLIMSIDYEHNDIERVRYSLEGGKLHLVFHPVPRSFTPENVKYMLTGKDYDLFFALGAKTLSDLGEIFEDMKRDVEKLTTINIDISAENSNFGTINIVDYTANSLSELIFNKLSVWRFKPTREVARCLLFGLSVENEDKNSNLPMESLNPAV